MVNLKVEQGRMIEYLAKIQSNSKNLKPAYKNFMDYYHKTFVPLIFSSQGSAMGGRWKPLNPVYAKHEKGTKTIFSPNGVLAKSLKGQTPYGYTKIDNKNLEWGIKGLVYAGRLQGNIGGADEVWQLTDKQKYYFRSRYRQQGGEFWKMMSGSETFRYKARPYLYRKDGTLPPRLISYLIANISGFVIADPNNNSIRKSNLPVGVL